MVRGHYGHLYRINHMAKTYVERQRQVNADQFHVAVTPWPPGVDVCPRESRPHFHYPNDMIQVLAEGDWILSEKRNGNKSVMSNAEFTETFNVPGPVEA